MHDSSAPPVPIHTGQQRVELENDSYTPISKGYLESFKKPRFLFIKKEKRKNHSYTCQYHQEISVLQLQTKPPGQTSNPGALLTSL